MAFKTVAICHLCRWRARRRWFAHTGHAARNWL